MNDRPFPTPGWRHWPWILALAALIPFLLGHALFRHLFYFGDEIALLDEVDVRPYGQWLWYPVVEIIMPVFKLAWSCVVLSGSGSYMNVLWLSWLVHAGCVGLLAEWLRRNGFGTGIIVFCALAFAWGASEVETLGWALQSCSQMATLFFLLAALSPDSPGQLLAWCAASALSFSRGLVTGPVMAVRALGRRRERPAWQTCRDLGVCLLPVAVTAWLMMRQAPANSGHFATDAGHWRSVILFALTYLGGCPTLPFWFESGRGSAFDVSPATVVAAGLVKAAVVALAWLWATPAQRRVLLPLLLLDLGYALLLGLGRSGGNWFYAMGSRYQYNSLLCTLPFVGIFLARLLRRPWALAVATALIAFFNLYGWHAVLPGWVGWRGDEARHVLFDLHPVPEGCDLRTLPAFPNRRARQLVDTYHLH